KRSHDKIEFSHAPKIGCLHVSDPAYTFQKRNGRKPTIRTATEPDDATGPFIRRRCTAQIGNEDVLDAVAVEIDYLRVSWVRHPAQDLPGWRGRVWAQRHDQARPKIARQDIQPAWIEEVNQIDIGNRGVRCFVDATHLELLEQAG